MNLHFRWMSPIPSVRTCLSYFSQKGSQIGTKNNQGSRLASNYASSLIALGPTSGDENRIPSSSSSESQSKHSARVGKFSRVKLKRMELKQHCRACLWPSGASLKQSFSWLWFGGPGFESLSLNFFAKKDFIYSVAVIAGQIVAVIDCKYNSATACDYGGLHRR